MDQPLPRKCFISHSYRDAAARERLLASLPPDVEPFVFPPITVAPDEMVSNTLIRSILDHDGLIYLQSGYSGRSFWVAFERDYALRAGKQVFAFDPATGHLAPAREQPLDLRTYASYAPRDAERVGHVLDVMARERYFHLHDTRTTGASPLSVTEFTAQRIAEVASARGYLVAFWSAEAARPSWIPPESAVGFREFELRTAVERGLGVLFARLDDTPLPAWFQHRLDHTPLNEAPVVKPVQLCEGGGEVNMNRVDDLIVRLYWLIYRNRQESALE